MYKQYRVYYWAGRVSGKKKWIRLSDDYQEALFRYAEIEGSNRNTRLIRDAILRYQGEILPGKAPQTQKERGYQLRRLNTVFGHMRLEDVKPPHIQQYLDQREKKVAANREIRLLSTIYRHAKMWGLCEFNPCAGAFYHPEKARDQDISDTEFISLQEMAYPTMRAIIQIAYLTGMRRGDILDLKLSEIEDKGIRRRQGKTGKRQFFEMTSSLAGAINLAKSARKTRNLVYLSTNNKAQKITETGFNSAWRRLRNSCNLEHIHFHDIRGKALSDAKRKGGIDYAQMLGGHENRSQTEAYIRSRDTDIVRPLM